ncbi:MAG: helix-turn-helix domain-containing protein [Planctomycetia bacterium]|nr:helix-turn-helix domain-containing protein [Planctomycetia bacterium]
MATDPLAVRFGQRLRQLREAKGWSQEELATRATLHRTHISLIESAQRSVQLDTVEKLASALGIPPSDLFLSGGAPAPTTTLKDRDELERLLPFVREFQALTTKHGIDDVFQDNGGKLLQTLILLDLKKLPRREGNDATDGKGNEYELKTVNVRLTKSFSTHHHLNPTIIKKYRAVAAWYFSVYENIELSKIYRLTPSQLESFFKGWEKKWKKDKKDINNPKIPLSFVEQHGELIYPLPKKP